MTTDATAKAAFIARKRAAGLKELRNLWAHPDDAALIKSYVAKLIAKRAKEDAR